MQEPDIGDEAFVHVSGIIGFAFRSTPHRVHGAHGPCIAAIARLDRLYVDLQAAGAITLSPQATPLPSTIAPAVSAGTTLQHGTPIPCAYSPFTCAAL